MNEKKINNIADFAVRFPKEISDKECLTVDGSSLNFEEFSNLVTEYAEVPLPYKISDLKWTQRNDEELLKFLKENNFKRLESKIFDNGETNVSTNEVKNIAKDYKLITNLKDLHNLLDQCYLLDEIAVDTETDSINAVEANLVGISIAIRQGLSYYIPLDRKSVV